MFALRPIFATTVLLVTVLTAPSCGVKQYNAEISGQDGVSSSKLIKAYGPFYTSGQSSQIINTPGCSRSGGRPCISARASVGMPYGFDINSNETQGIPTTTQFPNPAAPYAATAEPGKTAVSSGPRAPQFPRAENRDLHLMQRQTASGDEAF